MNYIAGLHSVRCLQNFALQKSQYAHIFFVLSPEKVWSPSGTCGAKSFFYYMSSSVLLVVNQHSTIYLISSKILWAGL